ncbi:fimbria/pilus outer membrane usher protein [Xylophilus sp. GW821-FHT01B05]
MTEMHHVRLRAIPALVLCLCLPRLLSAEVLLNQRPGADAEPVQLYLELVVNGKSSGEVLPVLQRGHHYEIEAELLRRLNVRNTRPAGSAVAVDALPGVATEYDGLGQRLLLSVPPAWLPLQELETSFDRQRMQVASGSGLLLNYDAYTTTSRGSTLTSVWTEQRYFGALGVISNTGIARRSSQGLSNGYVRYDTRWTRTRLDDASQQMVGDVVSGALPWSNAVRLGGFQWSRNFNVRPDLVTYPLPQFAGQAAVPSAVDLFVNGYKASSQPVDPGPFTLGQLPSVSGAGIATVVTTDALGRQVQTSVPFYVSSQLLRPGLTDYSLSVGALRRQFGLHSFAYGRAVAAGVYREGLTENFTLEGQAQVGRGLAVAGMGGLAKLGLLGTVNASLSRGRADTRDGRIQGRGGWQYSSGYQYNTQRGSVSFQQIGRTAGYGDATTYADDGFSLNRRSRQLSASVAVGSGAIGAGWVDLKANSGERTRLAYASYTQPIRDDLYLSVTAGRTVETKDTQLRLQLTYMLDRRGTATAAATRTRGATTYQGGYQQAIASDGGFGWNISRTLGGERVDQYQQAALQYRNDVALLQGGVYGTGGQHATWAGATGSVGVMDGHVFAANRVGDSFALVSTKGVPDVPVRFENQLIGRTDAAGYLLVPQVQPYRNSRYEIDMLEQPADQFAPMTERQLAVGSGGGALVDIPVQLRRSATLTLLGPNGRPLPVGTPVRHLEAESDTVVGWDGVLFLQQLLPQNSLLARPQNGPPCEASFSARMYDEQGLRELHCTVPQGTAPGGGAAP